MTITREQFDSGYLWDDWLDMAREYRDAWHQRYRDARLGDLRAGYQLVPTPRYVMCLVDPAGTDSIGTVPYIAKACEQTGQARSVELRIFPADRFTGLLRQFMTAGAATTPTCVVLDDDWVQVGRWGPRPSGAEELVRGRHGTIPDVQTGRELARWYDTDRGHSTLREFLEALRGGASRPWKAGRTQGRHRWNQAMRSRRRR